mgnify:CR=1 FL=1
MGGIIPRARSGWVPVASTGWLQLLRTINTIKSMQIADMSTIPAGFTLIRKDDNENTIYDRKQPPAVADSNDQVHTRSDGTTLRQTPCGAPVYHTSTGHDVTNQLSLQYLATRAKLHAAAVQSYDRLLLAAPHTGWSEQHLEELKKKRRHHTGRLSLCSTMYLEAVKDPFRYCSPCLPVGQCVPSRKLTTFARGTMSTNAGKFGWICANPLVMVNNSAPSAGSFKNGGFAYTDGAGNDTVSKTPTAPVAYPSLNGIITGAGNSPFAATDFSLYNHLYRVVCGGIRVRYIGTALNAGGRAAAQSSVQPADGNPWPTLLTILADGQTKTHEVVPGKWITCRSTQTIREAGLSVQYPEQFSYQTQANCFSSDALIDVIFITSAVASQPLEFEIFYHYEIIARGDTNVRNLAPGMTDPIGGPAAMHVADESLADGDGSWSFNSLLHRTLDTVDSFTDTATALGAPVPAQLPATVKAAKKLLNAKYPRAAASQKTIKSARSELRR